eukprot:SAG31_NODE_10470_length_1134_cov_1.790338_1_plen_254_part_01
MSMAYLVATSALLPHIISAGPASRDDCAAHAAAVVVHGDARFTVLSERVLRLEKAPFVDDCTFTVIRRKTPSVPAFTHTLSGDELTISTAHLTLVHKTKGAPAPPSACGATAAVRHNVTQEHGKRSVKYPAGLRVAGAAACCAACAADTGCHAWIFREKNETGSSEQLNCWPMAAIGSIIRTNSAHLARTIGMKARARGFSTDEVAIKLKGGATWHPGMDGSQANLGGTISSWNEVAPQALLSGNRTYQPGVLS